jgi:CheY-like chemotaxis protein
MEHHPNVAPRILVVDDNAQNRALVEATLHSEGYEVELVASGEEALAAFEERMFPSCF